MRNGALMRGVGMQREDVLNLGLLLYVGEHRISNGKPDKQCPPLLESEN